MNEAGKIDTWLAFVIGFILCLISFAGGIEIGASETREWKEKEAVDVDMAYFDAKTKEFKWDYNLLEEGTEQ